MFVSSQVVGVLSVRMPSPNAGACETTPHFLNFWTFNNQKSS